MYPNQHISLSQYMSITVKEKFPISELFLNFRFSSYSQ